MEVMMLDLLPQQADLLFIFGRALSMETTVFMTMRVMSTAESMQLSGPITRTTRLSQKQPLTMGKSQPFRIAP